VEEAKVGLVPKVVVQGAVGPKEYAVLVTDRRSIFVLESASKAGIGAALGGVVGAAIASAVASRRTFDYGSADPEALAADPKSIVVPHGAIQGFRLKKGLGGYKLRLKYARDDGKVKKVEATLQPPSDLVKDNKRRGVKPKSTMAQYAQGVRELYQKALPPAVATGAEWKV
jgi:hypothetical protein